MSPHVYERPLLTTKEVAARLAVSEKTIRRLTKRGELPAVRVGGTVRYDPAEVRSYVYGVPR